MAMRRDADERGARWRRALWIWAALIGGAALLSGCLVSERRVELGPRATPLEPGRYVSLDPETGAVDETLMVALDGDLYRGASPEGDAFELALYQSKLGADVFFLAYAEEGAPRVLYGVARIADGALAYPFIDCDTALRGAFKGVILRKGSAPAGGCLITSATQGRAALAAAWMAAPPEPWTRFERREAAQ
ncbi:MAG: hypothetical protein AAGM38_14600 [Pseudomonadota bacterium]